MTEEEAKAKWCPFASTRLIFDGGPASDRCIASACMAWRWMAFTEYTVQEAASRSIAESFQANSQGKLGGYCGLAGKP